MFVAKTLVLHFGAGKYPDDIDRTPYTAGVLHRTYGSSLEGIRFEHVVMSVPASQRREDYDYYVRVHQARKGAYEYMRALDARNARLAKALTHRELTHTIEEVRALAKEELERSKINEGGETA